MNVPHYYAIDTSPASFCLPSARYFLELFIQFPSHTFLLGKPTVVDSFSALIYTEEKCSKA